MAAPIHNNGGRKADKLIGDALRVAAKRVIEGDDRGRTYLAKAAEEIVIKASEGDVMAFKEMADRLDGKPKQALEHEMGEGLEDWLERLAKAGGVATAS